MNGHPGGEKHSERMLALAAMQPVSLPSGARVLDLGAGDGSFLKLLRDRGYDAEGIDLAPRGAGVERGDCVLLCSDGLSNQVSDPELLFEIGRRPGSSIISSASGTKRWMRCAVRVYLR